MEQPHVINLIGAFLTVWLGHFFCNCRAARLDVSLDISSRGSVNVSSVSLLELGNSSKTSKAVNPVIKDGMQCCCLKRNSLNCRSIKKWGFHDCEAISGVYSVLKAYSHCEKLSAEWESLAKTKSDLCHLLAQSRKDNGWRDLGDFTSSDRQTMICPRNQNFPGLEKPFDLAGQKFKACPYSWSVICSGSEMVFKFLTWPKPSSPDEEMSSEFTLWSSLHVEFAENQYIYNVNIGRPTEPAEGIKPVSIISSTQQYFFKSSSLDSIGATQQEFILVCKFDRSLHSEPKLQTLELFSKNPSVDAADPLVFAWQASSRAWRRACKLFGPPHFESSFERRIKALKKKLASEEMGKSKYLASDEQSDKGFGKLKSIPLVAAIDYQAYLNRHWQPLEDLKKDYQLAKTNGLIDSEKEAQCSL